MDKIFSDFATPISPTSPEGIDIEYDARFLNIQTLAEGKPEQQYGDVIIEAEPPDWSAIEKLCTQILSESKDIRVFCYYTQALTALYGLTGFYKGCQSLHTNLKDYWEVLYPKLTDEDGEYDSFYRLGSIELLISSNGIINQLYDANLICLPNRRDDKTIKYVFATLTNSNDESYPGGRDKLIEDLVVLHKSHQDEFIYLEKSLKILEDIESIFNNHFPDENLDFSIINKPLKLIFNTIEESIRKTPRTIETSEETVDSIKENPSEINSFGNQNFVDINSLEIKDREEVKAILDKLTLYFRIKEPSHPAPLFIERLKRLLDMDFYDILKDISPGSVEDLDLIIGKKESNTEEDDLD